MTSKCKPLLKNLHLACPATDRQPRFDLPQIAHSPTPVDRSQAAGSTIIRHDGILRCPAKVPEIGYDSAVELFLQECSFSMLQDVPIERYAYPPAAPGALSGSTSGAASGRNSGPRILIATFGSLGDLHPYMALAMGLRARGYQVSIATLGVYRQKIEAVGLGFFAVRPDFSDFGTDPDMIKKAMDLRTGTRYLLENMILPHLEAGYQDLLAASQQADFLISHPATFAVPIIAAQRGLPWAASSLAPLSLASCYDPPLIASALWLRYFQAIGPAANRFLLALFRRQSKSWIKPIMALRRQAGVEKVLGHPFFEGQFSPLLNLGLFSPLFGPPQPDWPPHMVATGFQFMHSDPLSIQLEPALEDFLAKGEPPIVFTLGSTAVMTPGNFYSVAVEAARRIGRRAVLLAGPAADKFQMDRDDVFACAYAPHAAVFRRAAAVVHQGGVGTTAEALRSGKPMLVVPFSHDQPDNAHRICRLGSGLMLPLRRFKNNAVAACLEKLLASSDIASRAAHIGEAVARENGVQNACTAIEKVLPLA